MPSEEESTDRVRGCAPAAENDSNGKGTLKTLSSGERYISRAGWNLSLSLSLSVIYKLRS